MTPATQKLVALLSALILAATAAAWGCAPTTPIVAKMQEPWEEEYARAMFNPEALLPTPAPTPPGEVHTHPVPPEPHEPDLSRMAADLLGAPFRGIGWLLRSVF